MRNVLSFVLLAGCATGPASLEITPATATVHNLNAVPLPGVVARDASGQTMELTDPATWTVSPETVAKLSADGHSIELLADGTATVTAAVGEINATYTIEVSLPDALEMSPVDGLQVGMTIPLDAKVLADQAELAEHEPVTFTVSDPAIATVQDNQILGVAPGEVTVTATMGALTKELKVTVQAAEAAAAGEPIE